MQEIKIDQTAVISVKNLRRSFKQKIALNGISLNIHGGGVFGIVGENGAGKTTLIKHVLGMLRAQAGQVRTFGLDPVIDPKRVLSRIGYLSEDPDLPGWMNLSELMYFLASLYTSWDKVYAQDLLNRFDLDPKLKIRNLSKGQRAQAGLITAQAHRPDLLLLDEPSSGLDPIVRRDILAAAIRTVRDEGRTVVFSSHLLDEVQRVSEHVTILSGGQISFSGTLLDILESHHHLSIELERDGEPPMLPGLLSKEGAGRHWRLLCRGPLELLKQHITAAGACLLDCQRASLDEIFVAGSKRKKALEA